MIAIGCVNVRESLKNVIKNAIIFECRLPDKASGLDKSCLSFYGDECFRNDDNMALSSVIYNGIVEYAINQYKIKYDELDLEQMRVLIKNIRYNSGAEQAEKLKYGFYGEILLDLILRYFMKTTVLIARGYFYSVLENSEPKGFDAFHVMEQDGKLELWFGEAKFHQDYKQAIKQVLEKIHISLSDQYVGRNLIALFDWRDRFTIPSSKIDDLLSAWETNPSINIVTEMNAHNMRFIYPVFIAYEKVDATSYHNNIGGCIEYIKKLTAELGVSIPASFDCRLFFIFLPITDVKKVKECVIEWIEARKPLML